jgi:hypothetical protein
MGREHSPLVRFLLNEPAMRKNREEPATRRFGSRQPRQILVALGLALFAGCGKETQVEDLKSPVLLWSQVRGLCGQSVAVDGNGDVWFEHGCESGPDYHKVRSLTQPQVASLRAKFDALPSGPARTAQTCMGSLDVFSIVESPVTTATSACSTSPAAFDDVTALPPEFRDAASAMAALQP